MMAGHKLHQHSPVATQAVPLDCAFLVPNSTQAGVAYTAMLYASRMMTDVMLTLCMPVQSMQTCPPVTETHWCVWLPWPTRRQHRARGTNTVLILCQGSASVQPPLQLDETQTRRHLALLV